MEESILGENLKELREERGLKQSDVAQELNIPIPTYSSWERGRTEPGIDWLLRLADYFDVSVDRLLRPERSLVIGTFLPQASDAKFHPILNDEGFYTDIYPFVFSKFFLYDPYDKRFHVELIDSWRIDRKELSYTFYIHKDVKFHNGELMTLEDVKYSYEEFLKKESSDFYQQFISAIEVKPEEKAIQLKLKRWLDLQNLPAPYIIPKSYRGSSQCLDGSGPYRISRESREALLENPGFEHVSLESNTSYFIKAPLIQSVKFHKFGSIDDLTGALNEGRLVFAADIVCKDPRFQVERGLGNIPYNLVFKQEDDKEVDRSICRNADFRKAIDLVLNRKRMEDGIRELLGMEEDEEFPPLRHLFNLIPESQSQRDIGKYDPDKAMEYWARAKASLEEKGASLDFSVASAYASNDPVSLKLLDEVIKQLQKVGINARQAENNEESKAHAVIHIVKFNTPEFIFANLCSDKSRELWGYYSEYVRGLLLGEDTEEGIGLRTYRMIQDFLLAESVFVPLPRCGGTVTHTKALDTKSRLRVTSLFYGPDIIHWELH